MPDQSKEIEDANGLLTDQDRPPHWWVILQLTTLAFHMPLTVLSGGLRAHAEVESVVIVGLVVTAVALLVYFVLLRASGNGWKALAWTSVSLLFFWHWGANAGIGPLPTWLTTSIIFGLVLVAVGRFADQRLLKLGFLVGAVTLSGILVLFVFRDAATDRGPVVARQSAGFSVGLTEKPDITLIVLDGYGREDVIDEIYGYDNSRFLSGLKDDGFDVAHRSRANYTITHLSLPSMLNMAYMHPDGALMGARDLDELANSLAGDNETVRILKEHGYTYIHGDTAQGHNRCGPKADVCLPGPWLDVTMYSLLINTPIGRLIYPKAGDPSTALNLMRIEQMSDWQREKNRVSEGPTFSFLHLVLPHLPLYLTSTCETRVESELGGRILNDPEYPPEMLETRMEAWVEQVECANMAIEDFIAQAPEDELIIIVSDHGPDATHLHGSVEEDVTQESVDERLPNLTAVRLPQQCRGTLENDVDLVNVFATILSCLSDEAIEPIDGRYFAAGFEGIIFEFKDPNE